MRPHPPTPTSQHINSGILTVTDDTFSTGWPDYDLDSSLVIYNSVMANINDKTVILVDSTSKEITNVSIKPKGEGFDLWLFHAIKINGNHVDEAEIVGTWHFNSMQHFDDMIDKFKNSLNKDK